MVCVEAGVTLTWRNLAQEEAELAVAAFGRSGQMIPGIGWVWPPYCQVCVGAEFPLSATIPYDWTDRSVTIEATPGDRGGMVYRLAARISEERRALEAQSGALL